jgi:hypothetical protein
MTDTAINIELYKSLFKGRTDIYATHWKKEGRSGYMPAYKVDWTDFNKHKDQGGTLKDYKIDKYETISRILVHDTQRNSLILKDVEENANRFKTILILSEQKAHVDILT